MSVLAPAAARAVREPGLDAVEDIARQSQDDRRDAQADVRVEVGIFGGDERLAKERGDVVVADDQPSLDGEVANQLAVGGVDARDGARVVVVERGNFREIAGVCEQHAAQNAEHRGDDEQRDDAGAFGESNDVGGHDSVLVADSVLPRTA